jgi:hypothetical protein
MGEFLLGLEPVCQEYPVDATTDTSSPMPTMLHHHRQVCCVRCEHFVGLQGLEP